MILHFTRDKHFFLLNNISCETHFIFLMDGWRFTSTGLKDTNATALCFQSQDTAVGFFLFPVLFHLHDIAPRLIVKEPNISIGRQPLDIIF